MTWAYGPRSPIARGGSAIAALASNTTIIINFDMMHLRDC